MPISNLILKFLMKTKAEQQDEQSASSNAELLAELKDKLQFKYDRLELSAFTSKRTASSLDVAEQDFKYLTSSKPAFLSKANMTSAQKERLCTRLCSSVIILYQRITLKLKLNDWFLCRFDRRTGKQS